MSIYAKIFNGVVINIQVMQSTDYQDPQFTFICIDNVRASDGSPVQTGYSYDSTSNIFNPPV